MERRISSELVLIVGLEYFRCSFIDNMLFSESIDFAVIDFCFYLPVICVSYLRLLRVYEISLVLSYEGAQAITGSVISTSRTCNIGKYLN